MCPLGGTKSRPIASSFYKFYIVMSHWWYSLIAVVGGSGSWELETCPEMQGGWLTESVLSPRPRVSFGAEPRAFVSACDD